MSFQFMQFCDRFPKEDLWAFINRIHLAIENESEWSVGEIFTYCQKLIVLDDNKFVLTQVKVREGHGFSLKFERIEINYFGPSEGLEEYYVHLMRGGSVFTDRVSHENFFSDRGYL